MQDLCREQGSMQYLSLQLTWLSLCASMIINLCFFMCCLLHATHQKPDTLIWQHTLSFLPLNGEENVFIISSCIQKLLGYEEIWLITCTRMFLWDNLRWLCMLNRRWVSENWKKDLNQVSFCTSGSCVTAQFKPRGPDWEMAKQQCNLEIFFIFFFLASVVVIWVDESKRPPTQNNGKNWGLHLLNTF